ncbi:MAG: hypothetical protein V1851_00015 [Patescibacteria group bacterium]
MKIITVLPIFRNSFQKPVLFFSSHDFPNGSIILIPYGTKEKPALVIDNIDSKKQKLFLRQNKEVLKSIKNPFVLEIFNPLLFSEIQTKSIKINFDIKQSLEKILPKKTLEKINNLSEKTPLEKIESLKKDLSKITSQSITTKLKKFLPKKEEHLPRKEFQNIGDLLKKETKTNTKIHSEKHFLVNEIREYFGEKASKGKGSFSFYLGFFKKIPEATIYQYWSEVKQSRLPTSKQQKIFWWKIGQYLKSKKSD